MNKLGCVGLAAALASAAVAAPLVLVQAATLARSELVFPPPMPQPAKADDVVGLVLQSTAARAQPAHIISFGQVFGQGRVPAGQALQAVASGQRVPVQIDAKTTYPDGSICMAVVTMTTPPLPGRASAPVMLTRAVASAPAPLDMEAALRTYDLTVDLALEGSAEPHHLDAKPLVMAALKAATPSYWLQGPLATEIRVDAPVAGSLHVTLDVRAYANGTVLTDVQVRNDIAMGPVGGAVTYDAVIRSGGKIVGQYPHLHQFQYQNWHQEVWSTGAPAVNVQHDIAALEATGAVPNYDLTTGVSAALLASQAQTMAAPGWGQPLAANGVTKGMPMTGGRGDIGPTTQANAAWLMSQSASAAAYALGQADAAGAVPWNFYNAAAGTWLNTAQYPDIWTDRRGGGGSYTTGLTQILSDATSWETDQAHQPDLSYVAYLMTGSRYYLNELNAQASFSLVAQWPSATGGRNGAANNVIQGEQVRGAAWSVRQLDEAAYANPAGSVEKAFYTDAANANWRWLVAQLPAWTAQEGQTSGYIPGGYSGGTLPPWQQDYFVGTAVQAAQQGNADALTYLKWATNFIAGRFLNADAGFNPHNGAAYNLGTETPGKQTAKTWAEMQAATVALKGDNGTGWSHSEGDYGELALQSLAGIITTTHSAEAVRAYRYLQGAGAPFTDPKTLQSDVQFNIVPRGDPASKKANR